MFVFLSSEMIHIAKFHRLHDNKWSRSDPWAGRTGKSKCTRSRKGKMSPNANELVLNKAALFSVQYYLSLLTELSEIYRRVSKCCTYDQLVIWDIVFTLSVRGLVPTFKIVCSGRGFPWLTVHQNLMAGRFIKQASKVF